jgi:membrane-bound hydrogenase subunit beta
MIMAKVEKNITGKGIVKELQKKFGKKVVGVREDKHAYCVKKKETVAYWLKIDPSVFKEAVEVLCGMSYPFLAVISGRDAGKDIELIYHFYVKPDVDSCTQCTEVGINISVAVPKKKPVLPTITDLIPGAILSELEKQEMLGVEIEGIGNERAFLPEKHPKGDYPWRKDKNA